MRNILSLGFFYLWNEGIEHMRDLPDPIVHGSKESKKAT